MAAESLQQPRLPCAIRDAFVFPRIFLSAHEEKCAPTPKFGLSAHVFRVGARFGAKILVSTRLIPERFVVEHFLPENILPHWILSLSQLDHLSLCDSLSLCGVERRSVRFWGKRNSNYSSFLIDSEINQSGLDSICVSYRVCNSQNLTMQPVLFYPCRRAVC